MFKKNIPTYKFSLTEELISAADKHSFLKKEDFLPIRSEPKATGWDVRCAEPGGFDLNPGKYYKIPLGFRSLCPSGWWFELKPRSSTFAKRHLHALYGTIDEDYPNQLFFACQYIPDSYHIMNACHPKRIEFGDRICQIIPVRRQEMQVEVISSDEMDEEINKRNSVRKGGFGSTGNG